MYFLVFRISFIYAASCYTYLCSSLLDSGVCAELDSISRTTIHINDMGCGFQDCDRDYVEQNIQFQNQINCSGTITSSGNYSIILNEDVDCYVRNTTATDYNTTLDDYLLIEWGSTCYDEDGAQSDSICGLDGKKYCNPNRSSAVFIEFWNICDTRDNKIDNKTKLLWDYYYDSFIEILTAPYCTDNVFSAFKGPDLDFILDSEGFYLVPVVFSMLFKIFF